MADVQRDAAIIQALSTGHDLPIDAASDPVATLLQAWASDLGRDLDAFAPFEMPAVPVLPFDEPKSSKRHGRIAVLAGSTVAALVVSSGAAAAMTGDPLAAVKAPLHVLSTVNPFDGGDNSRDTLPDVANPAAKPNKLLADAQRALAQGDTEEAARLIALAEQKLSGNANPGQLHRLEHLKNVVNSGGKHGPDAPGNGQAGEHGGQGNPPDQPGAPDDPGTPPGNAGGNSQTGHANEPGSGQGKRLGSGKDTGNQSDANTHLGGATGHGPKPAPSPTDRATSHGSGGTGGTGAKGTDSGTTGKGAKTDTSQQPTTSGSAGDGKKSAKRSGHKSHTDESPDGV